MPVFQAPLTPPNGDRAPWQVAYPPFPRPQNAATQAPLPDAPWPSPAVPNLAWPYSNQTDLNAQGLPIVAQSGMPLRSHPNSPCHVSPAVAAYQDELQADILYRTDGGFKVRILFTYEQSKMEALLIPKNGAVSGNPPVVNAPDYLSNAPAQHRCLDTTGLDRYRCYDKSPGQFDHTVGYIRARRGRQAILNNLHANVQQYQNMNAMWRMSLARGMATGAPITWGSMQ